MIEIVIGIISGITQWLYDQFRVLLIEGNLEDWLQLAKTAIYKDSNDYMLGSAQPNSTYKAIEIKRRVARLYDQFYICAIGLS